MSDVTFLIPGLATDPEWIAQAAPPIYLVHIISRADAVRCDATDIDRWLLQQFNVPDADSYPIAPYSMLGDGLEPGSDYWLRADPVHLSIQRNTCEMTPPELLELTSAEAGELVAALNQHFRDDGLRFACGSNHRWYLRCPTRPAMTTRPLRQVAGRSIADFLPNGQDAGRWLHIANEAQMLLHSQLVNAAREARGVRTANGLWLWGGGNLQGLATQFDCVQSDDALVRGLTHASKIPLLPLATPIGQRPARLLIVDRSLEQIRSSGNVSAWHQRLENMEATLLAPAVGALRTGQLTSLTLVTDCSGQLREWRLARPHLRRVWRRRRSLAQLCQN